MKREYESAEQAEAVLKEALWLAWQAVGGPFNMGFLQDNPNANKEAVWDQAYNMKDYSGRSPYMGNKLNADYVFGRMLKLRVDREGGTLDYTDAEPTPGYQGWCRKYRSYEALFKAAESALSLELQSEIK